MLFFFKASLLRDQSAVADAADDNDDAEVCKLYVHVFFFKLSIFGSMASVPTLSANLGFDSDCSPSSSQDSGGPNPSVFLVEDADCIRASRVKVAVRVRPTLANETVHHPAAVVQESSGCVTPDAPKGVRDFYFDRCFGPKATQDDVYASSVQSIVDGVISGVNGAVLAYGQTGTGKTYTMEGLIPRALHDIFKHPNVISVRMSFVQIYLDRLHDLLAPQAQGLSIREDPKTGFYVDGLRSYVISNIDEATYVLHTGLENREMASTEMNMTSSRSHTIMSVTVRTHNTVGKLMMVDLAGSERVYSTSKSFDLDARRFQKTTSINVSLSALGNVIAALADVRSRHIPFRDSPLTKLIQEFSAGFGDLTPTLSSLRQLGPQRNMWASHFRRSPLRPGACMCVSAQ